MGKNYENFSLEQNYFSFKNLQRINLEIKNLQNYWNSLQKFFNPILVINSLVSSFREPCEQ